MGPENLTPVAIVGTLCAVAAVLFWQLMASLNKRAEDNLDRAKQAESGEQAAQAKALEISVDCSDKLSKANLEMARLTSALVEITKGLTDRRPSIRGSS